FEEKPPAECPIDRAVHKLGIRVGRQRRIKFLLTPEDLEAQIVGDVPGNRRGFVLPASKRAVELRIVGVEKSDRFEKVDKGDAVLLVPGGLATRSGIAFSKAGIKADVLRKFQANVTAQARKDILVQQSRDDQAGIERRQIAEVVVIRS